MRIAKVCDKWELPFTIEIWKGSIENQFLWIWRFLFTWGWNGKRNTFSISFYKADMETQVWSIGEY